MLLLLLNFYLYCFLMTGCVCLSVCLILCVTICSIYLSLSICMFVCLSQPNATHFNRPSTHQFTHPIQCQPSRQPVNYLPRHLRTQSVNWSVSQACHRLRKRQLPITKQSNAWNCETETSYGGRPILSTSLAGVAQTIETFRSNQNPIKVDPITK